ncbi:MAG: ABC transporter permease [Emergencia timonensis]|uniref:ABC transporter permease n=1 Tax=Emergencia timonensis TaxID=1776384 RepID=UPI00082AEE9C|nr:ABC transporter permease subunit [Emergencia timonensis]WNX89994.1 ABC transporter permease subunit [Emergencia timonensis]
MKKWNLSVVISHVLLAALFVAVLLPGEKKTAPYGAMLCALALMEGAYLYRVMRRPKKLSSASDIMSILWALMLVWEVLVSKLDLCHPVLAPALENIFAVFSEDHLEMGRGILSSLEILLIGVVVGLALGTLLGLICGWHQRLKEVFFPIAGVLAPIPSIVFAPYVIAIMPTFRSASVVVILLGIFWPTFLKTIISVESIDKNMVDSARTLELGGFAMIFEVLLPYSMPGIVKGLKVTMTTAVMMLTFAEMMGSTVGMGYYIVNYNTYGNYTKVIAGIMVVGLVVTLLSSLVSVIQKKAIKWQNY